MEVHDKVMKVMKEDEATAKRTARARARTHVYASSRAEMPHISAQQVQPLLQDVAGRALAVVLVAPVVLLLMDWALDPHLFLGEANIDAAEVEHLFALTGEAPPERLPEVAVEVRDDSDILRLAGHHEVDHLAQQEQALLHGNEQCHLLDEPHVPPRQQQEDHDGHVEHECTLADDLEHGVEAADAPRTPWRGAAGDVGHAVSDQPVLQHEADEAGKGHGGRDHAKAGQQRVSHDQLQEILAVGAAPGGKAVLCRVVAFGLQLQEAVGDLPVGVPRLCRPHLFVDLPPRPDNRHEEEEGRQANVGQVVGLQRVPQGQQASGHALQLVIAALGPEGAAGGVAASYAGAVAQAVPEAVQELEPVVRNVGGPIGELAHVHVQGPATSVHLPGGLAEGPPARVPYPVLDERREEEGEQRDEELDDRQALDERVLEAGERLVVLPTHEEVCDPPPCVGQELDDDGLYVGPHREERRMAVGLPPGEAIVEVADGGDGHGQVEHANHHRQAPPHSQQRRALEGRVVLRKVVLLTLEVRHAPKLCCTIASCQGRLVEDRLPDNHREPKVDEEAVLLRLREANANIVGDGNHGAEDPEEAEVPDVRSEVREEKGNLLPKIVPDVLVVLVVGNHAEVVEAGPVVMQLDDKVVVCAREVVSDDSLPHQLGQAHAGADVLDDEPHLVDVSEGLEVLLHVVGVLCIGNHGLVVGVLHWHATREDAVRLHGPVELLLEGHHVLERGREPADHGRAVVKGHLQEHLVPVNALGTSRTEPGLPHDVHDLVADQVLVHLLRDGFVQLGWSAVLLRHLLVRPEDLLPVLLGVAPLL
mmetsp:Transcript_43516/g.129975  ORF Transcript_43516/g.129975 Transcript_43516/m.129975 type:complete len:818 (-) Transcript_43516:124-2577(-)